MCVINCEGSGTEILNHESRRQWRLSNPRDCEGKAFPLRATTAYVGVEIQFHLFFTSALDVGKWSA
jgi:hypothetical protein